MQGFLMITRSVVLSNLDIIKRSISGRFHVILLMISVSTFCQGDIQRSPITTTEMKIEVLSGNSREVAYTNKQAGVYYTETNGEHRSGWQGWRIMSTEMMEDYGLFIDGVPLRKQEAAAKVYPHQILREYPDGIEERMTLLDSVDALVVELSNVFAKEISVRSFFTDSQNPADYEVSFEQNVLLIARKRHLFRTESENYPVWIGITIVSRDKFNFVLSSDTLNTSFSPVNCQSSVVNGQLSFLFVAGDTKLQTISLAKHVAQNYSLLIEKRKRRMEDLLNYSYVRTDNSRFDKALYWAKISMDALIMNQRGKGIFAGLPWFDNYWGRDSFISLAGATLVTGNFKDAKEILKSFAAWQDTNPNSTNYGRIPNLVTTNSISYNTADGTPRFVIALYEYVKYSGDTAFAREMYPVVQRSIEGTIKYHTDSLCFLAHGDAETWMDAVGPDGPWSPRGNRANDIQTLWLAQLLSARSLAITGNDSTSAYRWFTISEQLRKNFIKYFLEETTYSLTDHLNTDGTPDNQFRPNQLFCLDDNLQIEPHLRAKIFRNVTERLVYPHGAASLSQEDKNFHPFHEYAPFYVKDAAYHNGIVWTWLAGKWIDIAASYRQADLAFRVTENMVGQILDWGAIGTLSELIDAAPRVGEDKPRLSGTYSQAWSLAEFIKNFYQSYLGIRLESNQTVHFVPSLPSSIHTVHFTIPSDSDNLIGFYEAVDERLRIKVVAAPSSQGTNLSFDWRTSRTYDWNVAQFLRSGDSIDLTITNDEVINNLHQQIGYQAKKIVRADSVCYVDLEGIKLVTPFVDPNLQSLRGPSHRLLLNKEIKQLNPSAKILYDVIDPEGDDAGTGSYVYPQTVNLKSGSLDITHFTVSKDEKNIYFKLQFKNLSNPGWHPEYGFQLTYAAIAIDKGKENGSKQVGMNSNYIFTDGFRFQDVIYVGGGFRVVNYSGKILAEYLPASGDEKNPLGNANSKLIEFSIPIDLIGAPDNSWRYAVLVGCQDDHGGAGIGEFRSVEAEAKEWVGGGRKNLNEPNVYDIILSK